MKTEITILIADDHPVFRRGLREILEAEPGFRIDGEAADGESTMELIRNRKPQVAVLDIEMPKMTGLEVAECVHREDIPTFILILTMYEEEAILERAMELGVMGYLIKDSADDDIIMAIKSVAQGNYFLSPRLVSSAVKKRKLSFPGEIALQLGQLTLTERYVLRKISQSKTTREIAEGLSISPRTVEVHRYNISQKLHLSGSYAVLRFALENRALLEEDI